MKPSPGIKPCASCCPSWITEVTFSDVLSAGTWGFVCRIGGVSVSEVCKLTRHISVAVGRLIRRNITKLLRYVDPENLV